jgi:EmrB/QacA subfamily drug resistance transporter
MESFNGESGVKFAILNHGDKMVKKIERKWWVLIAIGAGTFMSALDASVVNIILPIVRESFNSSVATVEWVVTVYLLVISGMLLTFGRLGDLKGHKTIYILGFGLFITFSALSGSAWSPTSLVIFRAFQAFGGAMLASNSAAIVTDNFPVNERGRAFGLISTMTYLGLTIGPVLGGWLTHVFNWRMVFYINIPVGLLAMLLSLRFIPKDKPAGEGQRFDILGAVLFVAGLSALMLGLNKGADWGWDSPAVLGLLISAMIILYIFIQIERRAPSPMLDLNLFRSQVFTFSSLSSILNYIAIYSVIFLMPFYLIQGRGFEPSMAGMILTVQSILMAITAPFSGYVSDKIGSRLPGMIGLGTMSGGLLLLSTIDGTSRLWVILVGLGLVGLGTGSFISPNTSALMGAAPANQQGVASAMQAESRSFGMVLGIGMAGAIFTTQLAANSSQALFSGVSKGLLAGAGIAALGVITSYFKKR